MAGLCAVKPGLVKSADAANLVRTPDGGRRPSSFLILGVINALEPKLSNLMVPFYQLNSDEDALVEVLGLNFDPEMALDNGTAPPTIDAGEDTPLLPDVPGF